MSKAKKSNDIAANLIGGYLLAVIVLALGAALILAGLYIWQPLVIVGAVLILFGLFLLGV